MGMRTAGGFYWILISFNLLHYPSHFCTTGLHSIRISGMIFSGSGATGSTTPGSMKNLLTKLIKYHQTWLFVLNLWLNRTFSTSCKILKILKFNHLTPNGHYMCRTAQITSRCCILYIYSTNIRTEYFKHAASPFFPLQNAVYFIMLPFLVPVLLTF